MATVYSNGGHSTVATVAGPQNAYRDRGGMGAGWRRRGGGGGRGAGATKQPRRLLRIPRTQLRTHIDARAGTAPRTRQRKHSGALWLRCSVSLVHLFPRCSFLRAFGDGEAALFGEAAALLLGLSDGVPAGLGEARVLLLSGVPVCRPRWLVTCARVHACVRVRARVPTCARPYVWGLTDSRPSMVPVKGGQPCRCCRAPTGDGFHRAAAVGSDSCDEC